MMTALQQELDALKVDRNQERETAKKIHTFLANQVRDLRSMVAPSTGPFQPPVQPGAQIARPASIVRCGDRRGVERKGDSKVSFVLV
jgi:hypothetical protein